MSALTTLFVAFLTLQTFSCVLYAQKDANLMTKLTCKTGESRLFAYESDTRLWGSLDERVKISANVNVHCMGRDNHNTKDPQAHKYMVEISKVRPKFFNDNSKEGVANVRKSNVRSKRGAGEWIQDKWGSVKKFFVGLFKRSKRRQEDKSTTSDIDIEFDELPSTRSSGHKCRAKLDPNGKGLEREGARYKRAANKFVYDDMFSKPFIFVQLSDGSVSEVRFSSSETDETVKNFKKHLADTFATQLNRKKNEVVEKSPIGEHKTRYAFGHKEVEQKMKTAEAGFARLVKRLFGRKESQKSQPAIEIEREVSQKDMIKVGTDNETIHDPFQVDINVKQVQQINEGHLTTTAGHLSLSLLGDDKPSVRSKRSAVSPRIEDVMKVKTQYSMKMVEKRTKREAELNEHIKRLQETEANMKYYSESLVATSSQENMAKERLITLRDQLFTVLKPSSKLEMDFLKTINNDKHPYYKNLMDVLDLEDRMKENMNPNSISVAIRTSITRDDLLRLCETKLALKKCKSMLLILVRSGSMKAVDFLLDSLNEQTIEQKSETLKLLMQTNRPDAMLIKTLLDRYRRESNAELKGQLITTTTILATKEGINQGTRDMITHELIYEMNKVDCGDHDAAIDILEAVGNLGEPKTIISSIQVASKCPNSESHLIAVVHSLRRMVRRNEVQNFYKETMRSTNIACTVKQAIIASLIEFVDTEEATERTWPKYGFNDLDESIAETVIKTNANHGCLIKLALKYYGKKMDDKARRVAEALKVSSNQRRKRAIFDDFWDDSKCEEKISEEDAKPHKDGIPVVSDTENYARLKRSEEVDDYENTEKYWKRRRCKAYRYFGPKHARAHLKADLITDAFGSRTKPEYKLIMQFAVGSQFLGKEVDVGKIFLYQKKDVSRAYVNVLGMTYADAGRNSCHADVIEPYRYTKHLPLYDFNIWIVQVSLGLRMDSEMSFSQASCKARSLGAENIVISPEASVRASGEASGKVLIFKGGTDIGAHFNYFSEVKFDPEPDFCLTAFNGHNPMYLGIQPWFQVWDITCNDWSERTLFKPKELNWEIRGQKRSPWIENECLLKDSKTNRKIDP